MENSTVSKELSSIFFYSKIPAVILPDVPSQRLGGEESEEHISNSLIFKVDEICYSGR